MKKAAAENPFKVFGGLLQFFREKAGWTSDQLGARVYLSGSQIRKIEAGTRAPTEALVRTCEGIPDLHCDGALQRVFEMLEDYLTTGVFPGWFKGWPKKEAVAVRLRVFGLVVLPGLVQTGEYARAIISTRMGITADRLDSEVAARLARQAVLDREQPLEYWVILDEAALRRPVGSREIMGQALTHLAELARRPNIVVQVIPLEAGAHLGLNGGSFEIAEFEDGPDAAYQDSAVSGQIIEDQDAVKELAHLWDALQRVTLPEAPSLRMIEEAVQLWT